MSKDKVIPIKEHIDSIKDDINTKFNIIENDVNKQTIIFKEGVNKLYNGWRNFAFKDDIINIAIGMIVAASFKNLVNSLVIDIITPCLIGFGMGTNTEDLFVILRAGSDNRTYNTLQQAKDDGAVTLNYGLFIQVFIDLIFVSIILYLIMRFINKVKKEIKEEIKKMEDINVIN
jgi:large conductance mechanosensitive channel